MPPSKARTELAISPIQTEDDASACARGQGLGSRLVEFAEQRILRVSPNIFSSFNLGARRLYERLGYKVVGELSDYIVRGHSELLLRKTTGPLAGFGSKGSG